MTSNEAVQSSPTIPETMRAAVLRDHDEGLRVETIRTPRPKAGEVLIKVAACGPPTSTSSAERSPSPCPPCWATR